MPTCWVLPCTLLSNPLRYALERGIAVWTTQPSCVPEVIEGKSTERARAKGLSGLGRNRLVTELGEKPGEREVDRVVRFLDTLGRRTLLAQMGDLHLVVLDLRQVNHRVRGAAGVTGVLGFLAFHKTSHPEGLVEPSLPQLQNSIGPLGQLSIVRHKHHGQTLTLL